MNYLQNKYNLSHHFLKTSLHYCVTLRSCYICHGLQQSAVDSAVDEWKGVFAPAYGPEEDILSDYYDNMLID